MTLNIHNYILNYKNNFNDMIYKYHEFRKLSCRTNDYWYFTP